MTNNNRDLMTDVGKYVFQEVKYVINAVGCSEKYNFLVKKKNQQMCTSKSYRFRVMTCVIWSDDNVYVCFFNSLRPEWIYAATFSEMNKQV